MLTEEILEGLRAARNIALTAGVPDRTFIELTEELLENNRASETLREFEEFLAEPDFAEKEREAQYIIRRLKAWYKARNAEVYDQEDENALLMKYPGKTCWIQVHTDAGCSMVTMKVLLPVLAEPDRFGTIARMLHNCNEDPDAGFGFFNLDDATGEISCIYRYSFAGGTFTEEGFHRYLKSLLKAASAYRKPIETLLR